MHKSYLDVASGAHAQIDTTLLRQKSVLITGSNGLLGSHMMATLAWANAAQDLGVSVTCTSRSQPELWLKNMLEEAGFEFIQADLTKGLPDFGGRTFDFVIHAATYGQPKKFLERPLETMTLNSTVTEQLLKLTAQSHGTFLFMSSSEIYGHPTPEVFPVKEQYHGISSPLDQRAAYTSSKRFGETLCKIYDEQKLVRARVARVSSVYGPGAYLIDDRVLNVFIHRALKTGQLKLMDQGEQKRRWLYITDALVMLFYILTHGDEFVYNVSGDDLRSIADLATYVGEITGANVEFPFTAEHSGHTIGAPDLIDIDNGRIVREANMQELISLKEGLKACVAWFRDLLSPHQPGGLS